MRSRMDRAGQRAFNSQASERARPLAKLFWNLASIQTTHHSWRGQTLIQSCLYWITRLSRCLFVSWRDAIIVNHDAIIRFTAQVWQFYPRKGLSTKPTGTTGFWWNKRSVAELMQHRTHCGNKADEYNNSETEQYCDEMAPWTQRMRFQAVKMLWNFDPTSSHCRPVVRF